MSKVFSVGKRHHPSPQSTMSRGCAGVSKKTVSRVINRSPLLNEETREKVEAVIVNSATSPIRRRARWRWDEIS